MPWFMRKRTAEELENCKSSFRGKPRFDAEAPLILNMVDADNDGAVPESNDNCFFAKGGRRQCNSADVVVSKSAMHVLHPSGEYYERLNLPPSLKKEAHALDTLKDVPERLRPRRAVGDYQCSPFPPSKKLGQTQGTKTRPDKNTRNDKPEKRPDSGIKHSSASLRPAS